MPEQNSGNATAGLLGQNNGIGWLFQKLDEAIDHCDFDERNSAYLLMTTMLFGVIAYHGTMILLTVRALMSLGGL